jgi:hypothetical protein
VHLAGGQDRLREMILYVSERGKSAKRWGKTKLNKTLWRADFTSFYERGVPVTGRPYQRLEFGPAPLEMAPMLGEMINNGLISIEKVKFSVGVIEDRIIPNDKPNLSMFSKDDMRYIDSAIDYYWDDTARSASDDSHGVAWRTRGNGDAMPYELAYLSDCKLPAQMLAKVKIMAQEKGWKSE